MHRYFKSGDRVQSKSGGPIMEVIKYMERGKRSRSMSNSKILCVCFDKNGDRKEQVLHKVG